ncbi:MAG TPA: hypothetical protein VFX28_03750, partial [Methylomirabilota bacterium]|nr:hypothetical protein [Methylomirabilota bacterium]
RRLAALAPGGLEAAALHYNPFTGALLMADLRGRDAAGRPVFTAASVQARVDALALLTGGLTLRRVVVREPRLHLSAAAGRRLVDLATGGGAASRSAVTFEGLGVVHGTVVLEGVGAGGEPLVVRDLGLSLERLTAQPHPDPDGALGVEMTMYGATVRITGQPVAGPEDGVAGYALRVRARSVVVAALLRAFPLPGLGLERGDGDVDATVALVEGRVLLSGQARLADVAGRAPGLAVARLRARRLFLAVDRLDPATGSGRISRLELTAPVVEVAAPPGAEAWAARLRPPPTLVVRRLAVTAGTLVAPAGDGTVTLTGLELSAERGERAGAAGFAVTARGIAGGARLSVRGVLGHALERFEGDVHVERLDVTVWRRSLGDVLGDAAGAAAFDGRVRVERLLDDPRLTLEGEARLTRFSVDGTAGFRAAAVRLEIRRLDWPHGGAVLGAVRLERPEWGAGWAPGPWAGLLATGLVSVVSGVVHADPGALRDVDAEVVTDPQLGIARMVLWGTADGGRRVGLERWIGGAPRPGREGLPLGVLLAAVADAGRLP